jgi:hypothetical protein
LASRKGPQWMLDRAQADFRSCAGFIHGDAFAGLPERVGGYDSSRFWLDLAYQDNDPIAQAEHAGSESVTMLGTSNNIDTARVQSMQTDINNAAATGDPEALARIGLLLLDSRVGADPLEGFAVIMAACDLGYDCTANNEHLFAACVPARTCEAGEVYSDVVRKTVGENSYAQVFGIAQQLEAALSRGDTSAVQEFVRLKGT